MPSGCVSVCRPGVLGNPFRGPDAVQKFTDYAHAMLGHGNTQWLCGELRRMGADLDAIRFPEHRKRFREAIQHVADQKLSVACYCGLAKECHGDVILRIAAAVRYGKMRTR